MFNIYLGAYICVAILVILGGSYSLYSSYEILVPFLFFIGSLASFIIFGLIWFSASGAVFAQTPVSWPPFINTCPDYLVYYRRPVRNTFVDTCVDTIGVSSRTSRTPLLKFTEPRWATRDQFYFSLRTNATDPVGRNRELCTRAINAGLTWEGITNGETCTFTVPPPKKCV